MKKRNSQNIYLGALSLSDFFNIQINITLPILNRYKMINITFINIIDESTNKNVYLCIIYSYLVEVFLLLAPWIMVIMAIERFVYLMWPLYKNYFCTTKKAKITLFCLFVLILIWSMFKLKTAGVEQYSTFRIDFLGDSCREISLTTLVNISTLMW